MNEEDVKQFITFNNGDGCDFIISIIDKDTGDIIFND